MLLLGVECTASPVSCALFEDERLISEFYLNTKTTHSQTLMPMIESSLKLCGRTPGDIDMFAVTAGPGSFTGVRIGVSAVKGMAEPFNKPCVPVSVLSAMAYGMSASEGIVCAVMDARCNQFYNALFSVENGVVTRLCEDRALMADELIDELSCMSEKYIGEKIFVVGDGAELLYNNENAAHLPLFLAPQHLRRQRASCVCMAAYELISGKRTVTASELLPVYLRLPQAERELRRKKTLDK